MVFGSTLVKFSDGRSYYYKKERLEEFELFCSILSSGRCLELKGIDQQTFDRLLPWMRVLGPHDANWIAEAMMGPKDGKEQKEEKLNIEPFNVALLAEPESTVAIFGPTGSGKKTLKKYFTDSVLRERRVVDSGRWTIGFPEGGAAPTYIAVSCKEKEYVFSVPRLPEVLDRVRDIYPFGFLVWKVDEPSKLFWVRCPPDMVNEKFDIAPFDLGRLIPTGQHVSFHGPKGCGKNTLKQYFFDSVLRMSGKSFQGTTYIDCTPWASQPAFVAVSCRQMTWALSDSIPRFKEAMKILFAISPYSFLVWHTTEPTKLFYAVAPPLDKPVEIKSLDFSQLMAPAGSPAVRVSIYGASECTKMLEDHILDGLKKLASETDLRTAKLPLFLNGAAPMADFTAVPLAWRDNIFSGDLPFPQVRFREAMDALAAKRVINGKSFLIWDSKQTFYGLTVSTSDPLIKAETLMCLFANSEKKQEKLYIDRFDPTELVRTNERIAVIGPAKSGRTTLCDTYNRRLGCQHPLGPFAFEDSIDKFYIGTYVALSCCPSAVQLGNPKHETARQLVAKYHPYGFVIWNSLDPSKLYWEQI